MPENIPTHKKITQPQKNAQQNNVETLRLLLNLRRISVHMRITQCFSWSVILSNMIPAAYLGPPFSHSSPCLYFSFHSQTPPKFSISFPNSSDHSFHLCGSCQSLSLKLTNYNFPRSSLLWISNILAQLTLFCLCPLPILPSSFTSQQSVYINPPPCSSQVMFFYFL